MANDERPLPKGWPYRYRETVAKARQDLLAKGFTARPVFEPKHPAYRATRAEIRQLEDELQLRRCAACDEGVIEGQNEGSQMKSICAMCLRRASEPGAA